MLRFAKPTCPIRTDRFSRVLFALGTAQLQPHSFICSLLFSKSSANLFWFSRQNCKASRIVEESFDGVPDPVDTSNRPIVQVGPKLPESPFESSQ
jgi:hypothetical protein